MTFHIAMKRRILWLESLLVSATLGVALDASAQSLDRHIDTGSG